MKKVFAFFSCTGNGDFLSTLFKEKEYEIHKVETLKPFKKMNFFRIFRYGYLAATEKELPIKDLELVFNREDDEVVIGSPIWNDRLANPVLTLLNRFDFNKDTTLFVLYAGGGKAKHAEAQLKKLGFKREPIILKQPLSYQDDAREALKDL